MKAVGYISISTVEQAQEGAMMKGVVISILRAFLIIIFLLSIPQDTNAAVYECRIMDTAYWRGSQIVKSPTHDVSIKTVIEFDDLSGALIWAGNKFGNLITIQRPSKSSDLVAVSKLLSPYDSMRGQQSTLRIRGWNKDQGLSFLYVQHWEMFSGNCDVRSY